jgi:hypothetical protein
MSDAHTLLPVFLDECGYTGEDLANKEQPFFVLATHALSEDESKAMLQTHFARVQAKELKHTDLAKRPRQRAMVLRALDDLRVASARVKVSLADKQFVLVTKIVDLIVENAMHETGVDLYERGGNISLSNLLYLCLPVFGGPQFLSDLVARFQRMMRERTHEAYDAFFRPLFEEQHHPKLEELLMFVKAGHMVIGRDYILETSEGALDLSMASAFALLHSWRRDTGRELVLYHDRSSNMQKDEALWQAIVSPHAPAGVVGYDRRTITFPIGVAETKFEDSKSWAGLQLADILAGAVFYWARWKKAGAVAEDAYGVELEKRFSTWAFAHSIHATTDISPAELGTDGQKVADANEFIGRLWAEKGLL